MENIFRISVPDERGPVRWCKEKWDTFGFDYDISSSAGSWIDIWPLEDTDQNEMVAQLKEAGISFEQ